MTGSFYRPSFNDTSVGVDFRVVMLPQGLRTPTPYNITVGAAGTTSQITTTAAAVVGATTLTVTAVPAGGYPANSILQFGAAGGPTVLLTAAAAAAATSLTVAPLAFDVPNGSTLIYNAGTITTGSFVIPVTALPVRVDVDTRLTFGGQTVITTRRSPAGATQLFVTNPTNPTAGIASALTSGNTATTLALEKFVGLQEASFPNPELKIVDVTRQTSGTGKDSIITQQSIVVPCNYQVILGDWGGETFNSICTQPALMTRELYFESTTRNGEVHRGVGIPTSNTENGTLQDKRMRSANMQVQGETYSRTASTYTFW